MGLRFEWDENKARQNIEKHHVSFEEDATVLGDPPSLTVTDHCTPEKNNASLR